MKLITKSLLILFAFGINISLAQKSNYAEQIDSLISRKTTKPFNGIILISKNGKTDYLKIGGYSDIDKQMPIRLSSQFVIGSISKQFTAVLILREYDKGRINLHAPIHTYLPELSQSWADTVTVHHLLTHTHGIKELDQPTTFKAGTLFAYSQIGYDLLAQIAERTSGKSFAQLSSGLFKICGMTGTFHPAIKHYENLVKGYTEQQDGHIFFEEHSLESYPAAGSFISTVSDLVLWNEHLNKGKLLKPETYQQMISKQKNAIRQHPIFGLTEYGYGITVNNQEHGIQIGQTGFVPGFVTMNYYYPATRTSVIVLENIVYDSENIKNTFRYHTAILAILKNSK